jgi:SPP1 gp7 family putative phage head morphogenesis protein
MSGLNAGWKIGSDHAKRELRKANADRFTRESFATTDRALTDIAAEYFKQRAHEITGSISDQTKKAIQNAVMLGIKGSLPFSETKKSIYKALETEGLIDEESVQAALGTRTVKDTKARIQTIMRTSTFEAINEARMEYFTDPALGGFVEALEYSAIMDDRTTEICSEMDGKIYPAGSDVWQTLVPPNHWGCRSLLIAVTERDAWTESPAPTVTPQKGFSRDK